MSEPNPNSVAFINAQKRLVKVGEIINYVKQNPIYPTGIRSYNPSSYQESPTRSPPLEDMSDLKKLVEEYDISPPGSKEENELITKIITLYEELKPTRGPAGGRRKKSHRKHKKHARRTRRHR